MSITWEEASQSVIHTAEDMIKKYHPHLREATIVFMFRSESSSSGGKEVYSKAAKVTAQMRALLDEADFIIWVSQPDWEKNNTAWREALIDHELCHCLIVDGEASLRPHDVEEFLEIINRHGYWNATLKELQVAYQEVLPGIIDSETKFGRVFTLSPDRMNVEVKSFNVAEEG